MEDTYRKIVGLLLPDQVNDLFRVCPHWNTWVSRMSRDEESKIFLIPSSTDADVYLFQIKSNYPRDYDPDIGYIVRAQPTASVSQPASAPEPVATAPQSPPPAPATATPAGTATPAPASATPAKKSGWWPFGKKEAPKTVVQAPATPAPATAGTPAAPAAPAGPKVKKNPLWSSLARSGKWVIGVFIAIVVLGVGVQFLSADQATSWANQIQLSPTVAARAATQVSVGSYFDFSGLVRLIELVMVSSLALGLLITMILFWLDALGDAGSNTTLADWPSMIGLALAVISLFIVRPTVQISCATAAFILMRRDRDNAQPLYIVVLIALVFVFFFAWAEPTYPNWDVSGNLLKALLQRFCHIFFTASKSVAWLWVYGLEMWFVVSYFDVDATKDATSQNAFLAFQGTWALITGNIPYTPFTTDPYTGKFVMTLLFAVPVIVLAVMLEVREISARARRNQAVKDEAEHIVVEPTLTYYILLGVLVGSWILLLKYVPSFAKIPVMPMLIIAPFVAGLPVGGLVRGRMRAEKATWRTSGVSSVSTLIGDYIQLWVITIPNSVSLYILGIWLFQVFFPHINLLKGLQ